jgi:putative ABC transport system permease protein
MRRWRDEGLSACLDALRNIRGYPGTAAWSIGLFAFGTAFFLLAATLVWRVIIHPKDAAPAAAEMVMAKLRDPARGLEMTDTMGWRYAYIGARQTTLECWVASQRPEVTNVEDRNAERHFALAQRVSDGFRQCWGLTLRAGREFRSEDHEAGAERVAIMGETIWRDVYGADPALVGETVRVGDETVRVVGISTSLGKPDLGRVDVWLPATDEAIEFGSTYVQVWAYGRPRDGVSFDAVDREFAQLDADYLREHPDNLDSGLQGTLHRHEDVRVGPEDRKLLWAMFVPFVGVFLLACANASGLLLIQFAGRARATALRMALGASRSTLVLRFVLEGLWLAIIGGLFGLLALRLLLTALPELNLLVFEFEHEQLADEPWDNSLVVIAPAVILVGTMLIALFPGLTATRLSVHEVIQDGARSVSGGRRVGRLRDAIANCLVGLGYLLVVTSISVAAGLTAAFERPLGYEAEGLVTAHVRFPTCERRKQAAREANPTPGRINDPDPEHCAPQRRFSEGIAALPFVDRVALGSGAPIAMGTHALYIYAIGDEQALPFNQRPIATWYEVEEGYFDVLGARLVAGRFIDERDLGFDNCGVNASQSLADVYGGPEAILGETMWAGMDGRRRCTVVGVVGEMNMFAEPLQTEMKTTYSSRRVSEPGEQETYVLRVHGDASEAAAAIEEWAARGGGEEWEVRLHAVEPAIEETREVWMGIVKMFGLASVAALVFAGLGIYGIVAYSVTLRRGEHALRMALGASSSRVMFEIVVRQLRATWPGLALGVVASLVATPIMAESIGLPVAFDLATGVLAMIIIVGAVVLAALLPALRVRSIDPWATLREE